MKIVEVFPDSPAAKAGLRAGPVSASAASRQSEGDLGHVIVGADGWAIHSEEDLSRVLALSAPSHVMKFLVTAADGNAYEVIPVTLGVAPQTLPVVENLAEKTRLSPSALGDPVERRLEAEIFQAVNRVREQHSLPPLQRDPQLQRIARRHSEDMATHRFFAHRSPDGRNVVDRLRAEGIADFTAAGENIFTGNLAGDPVQAAVQRWRKSPDHRKNLLSPRYTEGGVGVAGGEQQQIYITQVFLER